MPSYDMDAPVFRPSKQQGATAGNSNGNKNQRPKQAIKCQKPANINTRNRLEASQGSNGPKGNTAYAHNSRRDSHEQRKKRSNNQQSSSDYSPYDYLPNGEHAHNKTSFINTSFQFVVDSACNTLDICNNPDAKVPMQHVLRVLCEPTSCPICLEDVPEAPRMLECGHIMCLPCMIRFEAAEPCADPLKPAGRNRQQSYRECPLCFQEMRPLRSKPVTFQNHSMDAPKVGHEAVLRLMFRPRGSLLAVPLDIASDIPKSCFLDKKLLKIDHKETGVYSRVLSGTADYAIAEIVKEIALLKESKQSNIAYFGDDGQCYDDAISRLREEIKSLARMNGVEQEMSSSIDALNISSNIVPEHYGDDEAFHFYQTGFGLPTKYVLSPLDVKILRAAYGEFSSLPQFLIAPVQHIEYGKYSNADLVKKIKYLGHFPTHTPLAFLECDWNGIIDKKILNGFSEELKKRKKRKEDQQRKENREKVKFERIERNKLLRDVEQSEPYVLHESVASEGSLRALSYVNPALPTRPLQSFDTDGPPTVGGKTVWGTQAVKFAKEDDTMEAEEDDIDRVLREAQSAPRSKGRKKLVLYASR